MTVLKAFEGRREYKWLFHFIVLMRN
jgi:hypothetical protein